MVIFRFDQLQMRNVMSAITNTVHALCVLHRVQCHADRTVADRVAVHLATDRIQLRYELCQLGHGEDRLTRIIKSKLGREGEEEEDDDDDDEEDDSE